MFVWSDKGEGIECGSGRGAGESREVMMVFCVYQVSGKCGRWRV